MQRYCEAQASQRAIDSEAILQSASPLCQDTNNKGHASRSMAQIPQYYQLREEAYLGVSKWPNRTGIRRPRNLADGPRKDNKPSPLKARPSMLPRSPWVEMGRMQCKTSAVAHVS